MVYDLWWFMVARGSNLWYIPTWELVRDMTRTDLGMITCDTFSIYIYWFVLKFTWSIFGAGSGFSKSAFINFTSQLLFELLYLHADWKTCYFSLMFLACLVLLQSFWILIYFINSLFKRKHVQKLTQVKHWPVKHWDQNSRTRFLS